VSKFWSGKRVLLTGHTGFKGAWLSLWLEHLGAKVFGYALPPTTTPNLFDYANAGHGLESQIGDVRDLEALCSFTEMVAPEIVIHMAAQALVRYSYKNPVETYSTNVMGTVHVLEAVRRTTSVRAVLVVTTDKCYENQEWVWGYREGDPLGGYDPYSNSKGCAELVVASYRSSFFNSDRYSTHKVAIATARSGNVIGGGDWSKDRLVPDILASLESNECINIRNPNSIRPWQHVLDPLHGYLMLAEKLYAEGSAFAEAWNFGPADEDIKPVSWIAQKMIELWGPNATWRIIDDNQLHEATFLKLDISKARSKLGWLPSTRLETALEMVVAWSRDIQAGANPRAVTINQILRYQKKLEH